MVMKSFGTNLVSYRGTASVEVGTHEDAINVRGYFEAAQFHSGRIAISVGNQQSERKETARLHAKKVRQERKEAGQCRSCSNKAIPGQTRCENCRDKHNRNR